MATYGRRSADLYSARMCLPALDDTSAPSSFSLFPATKPRSPYAELEPSSTLMTAWNARRRERRSSNRPKPPRPEHRRFLRQNPAQPFSIHCSQVGVVCGAERSLQCTQVLFYCMSHSFLGHEAGDASRPVPEPPRRGWDRAFFCGGSHEPSKDSRGFGGLESGTCQWPYVIPPLVWIRFTSN